MSTVPIATPAQGLRRRVEVGPWFWRLTLALTLLLVGVFFVWPLLDILLRSLDPEGRVSFTSPNLSLEHYSSLFSDPLMRTVLRNTVIIAALGTLATLALAFPTAYLMSRLSKRAATVLYATIALPLWINILVRLFADLQLLSNNGLINWGAEQIGAGPFQMLYTTGAVTFGMVTYLLPILVLVLYTGMAAIDPNLITAAKAAGASGRYAFRRIFLPLIWPSVIGGALLVFVLALGFFVTPAMLGGLEVPTVATYIGEQVQNFEWGVASAMGVVLLLATVVVAAGVIRLTGLNKLAGTNTSPQKGSPSDQRLKFGPVAVLLWACASLAVLVTLAPLVMVIIGSFDSSLVPTWPPAALTIEWYREVFSDAQWFEATAKSARVAILAAAVASGLGFCTARALLQMRSGLLRSLTTGFVYAPLIVPVILLAIGTYDTQDRLGLLGTEVGLAAVHAVLALPFTVTVFLAALRGFDRRLEQAGWTLGASRWQTTRRVVLPIIMPSAIGAALLALMISWDEVVVALFQTEGSVPSLPALFYSFVQSGFQPTVNAVGTMLIAAVALGAAAYFVITKVRHKRWSAAR